MPLKKYVDQEDEQEKPPAPKPRFSILYVEDEDVNWEVAALHLEEKYHLTRAVSARDVFDKLAKHHFDAILMDIQLAKSELNGIQLTQILRGKYGGLIPDFASNFRPTKVPILFVTAYSARYKRDDLIAAGGDDLLIKPVNFVALATTLSRTILRSLNSKYQPGP